MNIKQLLLNFWTLQKLKDKVVLSSSRKNELAEDVILIFIILINNIINNIIIKLIDN